jgi:hypothetical protein
VGQGAAGEERVEITVSGRVDTGVKRTGCG